MSLAFFNFTPQQSETSTGTAPQMAGLLHHPHNDHDWCTGSSPGCWARSRHGRGDQLSWQHSVQGHQD